jgi:hypothetical protein
MSNEKKYDFLRNYKAPDFKQKRLNFRLDLSGGNHSLSTSVVGSFNERTSLSYWQYSNSQKYQGNFLAHVNSVINWEKSDLGSSFAASTSTSLRTTNRFYIKPNWFIGVYGTGVIGHSFRSSSEFDKSERIGLSLSPTVSIGNGRLEPIQYARNAMDIEKQLNRGNRLTDPYTIEELNQIAEQLAIINNVRFYDFRLRRIEQFEAIDETLREIGGINEFDVSYFAHLADAYLYAQNFSRYSGYRVELGITSASRFDHSFTEVLTNNQNFNSSNLYSYLSYNLPQSYAIQHTFFTSAIAGGVAFKDSNMDEFAIEQNAWVNLGYELGIYPTTRTNFNFGAKAGAELTNFTFGTDVYLNGAVYLSPQFRLSFEANFSPKSDYVAPVFMAIPSISTRSHNYVLGGSVSLQYAIF